MPSCDTLNSQVSQLETCRIIREQAKLGKITLDMSVKLSELNKHLVDYIEHFGIDLQDYVRSYLSNVQPYMITKENNLTNCLIEGLYGLSITDGLTVRFTEKDRTNGVTVAATVRSTKVPVFADRVLSQVSGTNKVVIRAVFQVGLLRLPLELAGYKHNDIFLVDKRMIDSSIKNHCEEYISSVHESDYIKKNKVDTSKIKVFSRLQQLPFTVYGNDVFSNITVLIDRIVDGSDIEKADFAMVKFTQNTRLTREQQTELKELLREKYTDIVTLNRVFDFMG